MKLHTGTTGWNDTATANVAGTVRNSQAGWVITGASGANAEAHGSIQSGQGDVFTLHT